MRMGAYDVEKKKGNEQGIAEYLHNDSLKMQIGQRERVHVVWVDNCPLMPYQNCLTSQSIPEHMTQHSIYGWTELNCTDENTQHAI